METFQEFLPFQKRIHFFLDDDDDVIDQKEGRKELSLDFLTKNFNRFNVKFNPSHLKTLRSTLDDLHDSKYHNFVEIIILFSKAF